MRWLIDWLDGIDGTALANFIQISGGVAAVAIWVENRIHRKRRRP